MPSISPPPLAASPGRTRPRLKALLDHVREALANGDVEERRAALAELHAKADALAAAPDTIRAGVVDPGFAEQAAPWLEAMQLWGRALQQTATGLEAADRGHPAARYFADAKRIAADAAAVPTIPGATRFGGPVKLADGVLDTFIAEAPGLIAVTARP